MALRLVLATHNPAKLEEFARGLSQAGLELLSPAEAGLGEAPEETGSTYEENAFLKAAQAAHASGLPALADDSGLEVDALGGAPGVISARYGGNLGDGERMAYLLSQMRQVPRERRGAALVSVLVLATADGRVETFRGECRGEILRAPRGDGGFGYDPLFWSPELGKSFAEASPEEKDTVSHRSRAIRALAAWLEAHGGHLRRAGG